MDVPIIKNGRMSTKTTTEPVVAHIVTGDHGMTEVHTQIRPNVWLVEAGLPSARWSGLAMGLGLDRLLMLALGKSRLAEVLAFDAARA